MKASWRRRLIQLKYLGMRSIGPIDYLSRILNDKRDFPPIHLRAYVGPLRYFESSGAEYLSYLKLIAELQPEEKVLDIGCGCGLIPLSLIKFISEKGAYVGLEIHEPAVKWCIDHISSRHPNFRFQHIDVRNMTYNAGGKHRPEEFKFDLPDGSYDIILLKSVFTHMQPASVDNYLEEIARLLSDKGRCLATFFLLNEEQKKLEREGMNSINFQFDKGHWRYSDPELMESSIGYEEAYLRSLLEKHGFNHRMKIFPGRWTGNKDGLSFQDITLFRK